MIIFKKILPLLILIAFSYFTIKPLFIPGFFPIHDDTQVQRVFEMKKSLSDGIFPVRWVEDLGYGFGYPIFSFYAPLAYYIGGFLSLSGFDPLIAAKIMLGLGVILSGITMFFFAKEFWGKIGGVVSGILYLFAPYHALNIFVRGDFAEIWAYAFIPLVFLGTYKIYCHCERSEAICKKNKNLQPLFWIIISALSFAAIIISHNLTAMMITPFMITYALILTITSSKNARSSLISHLSSLIFLGLLLSAFYWLPALSEMKYTNVISQIGGGADFRDHFVCPPQLWDSQWGFGGSVPGCADGLSFRAGKIHLILASFSLIVLLLLWKKQKSAGNTILFFIISFLASVFLMLEISKPVWESIPQMAYFQYPWRFLVLTSFTTSFLAGSIIILSKSKIISLLLGSALIAATLFINAKLFIPQYIKNIKVDDFINESSLKWRTSKISDEYMPQNFSKPQNENEIPDSKFTAENKETKIKILQDGIQQFSAKITSRENTSVIINLAYFPAWHTYLDNSEIPYIVFNKGLKVTIPKGEHVLSVKFIQTPIEKFADLLSLAGVIALFIGIITSGKEIVNAKKTT